MPVFLKNCFRKQKKNLSNSSSGVTEVKSLEESQGNFLLHPYEEALEKAGESRSIRLLEAAIEDAKQSGLLGQSKIYSSQLQRLQIWKSVTSDVAVFSQSNNAKKLSEALERVASLDLQDDDGLFKYAEIVQQVLLAKYNLEQAVGQDKVDSLERALANYREAAAKLEPYRQQKKIDLILLACDEISTAESHFQALQDERNSFLKNPGFPKRELEKAIRGRKQKELGLSIRRWRRLSLDLKDDLFKSALGVFDEVIHQNKKIAIKGLEQKWKDKSVNGLKKYLECAKEANVSSRLIIAYEQFALPTLMNYHDKAKDIVQALQRQDYEGVDNLVTRLSAEEHFAMEDSLNRSRTLYSPPSQSANETNTDILNKIEDVKSQSEVILNESRNVITAARHLVKAFRGRKQSLAAMDANVEAVLATLSSHVKEHCTSRQSGDGAGFTRHSLLQSPNDRLLLSRNIINSISGLPDKLLSSIKCSRTAIKSFETALKYVKDPIGLWEKRNAHLQGCSENHFDVTVADFTVVHDAENVLQILQRLFAVAKAENSLTFFETSPSTPRDRAEVENIVVHIKEGLTLLTELDDSSTKMNSNFINLCYNDSKYKTLFVNNGTFQSTSLILGYFSKLFPERMIAATKKAAEIQLVELQLFCADEEARMNSAKYALKQAIATQSEGELVRALRDINNLSIKDSSIDEAEKELTKIRVNKRLCRDALRVAIGKKDEKDLEDTLSKAEEVCLPPTDTTFVSAKRELDILRFAKLRREVATDALQQASSSNTIRDIRFALARAKICHVPSDNSSYIAAKQNLDRHRSMLNFADSSKAKFYHELSQKLNDSSDNNKCDNVENSSETKLSLSSRHLSSGGRQNFVKDQTLIKYFQKEIDQILSDKNGTLSKMSSARLSILIKYVDRENKALPLSLLKAAQNAISIVSERQTKAEQLRDKLEQAIKNNSLNELASAIAAAETEPEVLDIDDSETLEKLFELLAQAKENFALLNMHRKSEEDEKIRREISSARKNLKKAMLHESGVNPLKEAVEAFRLVCDTLSPRSLTQANKEKKLSINLEPTTYIFDAQSENKRAPRNKNNAQKQQDRFVQNTKKLYRSSSVDKQNIQNINDKTDKRKNKNKVQFSNTLPSRHRSKPKRLSSGKLQISPTQPEPFEYRHKRIANTEKKTFKHIPNTMEVLDDKTKVSPNGSILKRRPSSAVDVIPKTSGDYIPSAMLAWDDIESKNIALLKKAEKSLKKIKRDEVKRKEDEENQEFLESIKDELITNLRSSTQSGDRVDLWQAVHEFTRYFGDDGTGDESGLFVKAKSALQAATFSQYKENLRNAVAERNQEKLDHVLYEIENDPSDYMPENINEKNKFLREISEAKRLASHLSHLQKYRDAVMGMTRSLISEMNSYTSPPDVVKSVLAATYLLLGETEATVKNWGKVHALNGRLGRYSLTRRVLRCSPTTVTVASCRLASSYISELTHERVDAIGVGASIFFAWTKCMIFEVLNRSGIESEHYQDDNKKLVATKLSIKRRRPSVEFWQRLARSSNPTRPKRLPNISNNVIIKIPRAKSAKV